MRPLLRIAKIVAINCVVFVALLAMAEGAASLLLVANEIRHSGGVSEQSYSTYDETLGWVTRPNVSLPNLYGPGAHLRTNSQGFRADHDFTREVPAGKTRIICSGDSFTLGFGVSNDQAWCQRLAVIDPRLETVNMGQGGYGLDQAYLWYKRAGVALDHQAQLLSFITEDFKRIESDRFIGYGKPMLGLRGDSIFVRNRPVPVTSAFTRWRARKGHALTNLSIVQLVQRVFHIGEEPADSVTARDARARQVARRIFADLDRINREKNSRLVLVYLPGLGDYRANDATTSWRQFVAGEAAKLGIPFVDLVEAIRRVPPVDVNDLFLADTHYSPAGNDFIANALDAELEKVLRLTPSRRSYK